MAGIVVCPFTIIVDNREQQPWTFRGIKADARQQHRPMEIPWEWGTLKEGDYSIKGMESLVCIERKSLADVFGSCGAGRERFEREHQRMAMLAYAAVLIEADWQTILKEPPEHTKLKPKCIFRTAISWAQRYGVQWWAMPGRRAAELCCFRMLEKFWDEQARQSSKSAM